MAQAVGKGCWGCPTPWWEKVAHRQGRHTVVGTITTITSSRAAMPARSVELATTLTPSKRFTLRVGRCGPRAYANAEASSSFLCASKYFSSKISLKKGASSAFRALGRFRGSFFAKSGPTSEVGRHGHKPVQDVVERAAGALTPASECLFSPPQQKSMDQREENREGGCIITHHTEQPADEK